MSGTHGVARLSRQAAPGVGGHTEHSVGSKAGDARVELEAFEPLPFDISNDGGGVSVAHLPQELDFGHRVAQVDHANGFPRTQPMQHGVRIGERLLHQAELVDLVEHGLLEPLMRRLCNNCESNVIRRSSARCMEA